MSNISIKRKSKSFSDANGTSAKRVKTISFPTSKAYDNSASYRKTAAELKPVRESLPIYSYRSSLLEAIRKHRNLIIVGETGSGKTTQIPQYLYEEGYSKRGVIACTQPRRVAAINVADRVSQEVGCELGDTVGYTIRFDDKTNENTKVKYMTDGMLLRELQMDPRLTKYSVILLDESHERTLNTDILFGLLKQLQNTIRPDLKVLAMSATLDAQKFSKYFDAPVALIPGRTFDVDIYFAKEQCTDICESAVITALQTHQTQPLDGDILIFMPGADEIEQVITAIEERAKLLPPDAPKLVLYPLYSTLSQEKQLEAFTPTPEHTRKIVVSTNIAETSITLHGIKYVIDSGLAKVKTFNPNTGLEILHPQAISQAEAFQRSGRSGREREGVCYRLYTEDEFTSLSQSLEPEILRSNLASAVLQLKNTGIENIHEFDLIDKPSPSAIMKAEKELQELHALDKYGRITELGKMINNFPVEPRYARILIASARPETSSVEFIQKLNMESDIKNNNNTNSSSTGSNVDIDNMEGLSKKERKKLRKQQIQKEAEERAMKLQKIAEEKLQSQDSLDQVYFQPCSKEMCLLVAGLSTENILVNMNRASKDNRNREIAHRRYKTPNGDMLMLLQVLEAYLHVPPNEHMKWCKENYVNPRNIRAAIDAYRQLLDIMKQNNLPIISCVETRKAEKQSKQGLIQSNIGNANPAGSIKDSLNVDADGGVILDRDEDLYDDVRKCLLTGLFNHIAIRQADGKYRSLGEEVLIHPTSSVSEYIRMANQLKRKELNKGNVHAEAVSRTVALNQKLLGNLNSKSEHPFKVLLYHSIVKTSKTYIREIMVLEEDWLYQIQPEYFKDLLDEKKRIQREEEDRNDSHSNTLIQGQRTAFSNLTSKKLSATVDLAIGKAKFANKEPAVQITQAKSVVVDRQQQQQKLKEAKQPVVQVNAQPVMKKKFVPGFAKANMKMNKK